MSNEPGTEEVIQRVESEGFFDGVPVLNFTSCKDYTTFSAEHAVRGDDLVFHFFPTKEHPQWPKNFAASLEKVAMDYFAADSNRLAASFTPEMDSWWLLARGFASVGNPDFRAKKLYSLLDDELDRQQRA